MKIYLVSGCHWRVPGVIVRAAESEQVAQGIALNILNTLRGELELPMVRSYGEFGDALREANDVFGDLNYSSAEADIWIEALDVETAPVLREAA